MKEEVVDVDIDFFEVFECDLVLLNGGVHVHRHRWQQQSFV